MNRVRFFRALLPAPMILNCQAIHKPGLISQADEEYSEGERNLLIGGMPLYIWANFGLEKADLGYMSMHYSELSGNT